MALFRFERAFMTSCARGSAFRVALFGAVSAAAVLAGCASGSNSGPGSKALANGETCSSVKQQLNRLDAKGVPASVQAQAAGKKISAQQKADADLYNRLLDDYLGARCHV
jgi:hypothetical protein